MQINEAEPYSKKQLSKDIRLFSDMVNKDWANSDLGLSDNHYETLDKLPKLISNYEEKVDELNQVLEAKEDLSNPFDKLIFNTFQNNSFHSLVNDNEQFRWGILGNLENFANSLNNSVESIAKLIKLSALDGEKNAIIIGANGSGKSSFAEYFKKAFPENIVALPAQKLLYFEMNSSLISTTVENVHQLQKASNLKESHFDNANYYNRGNRNIHHEFSQIIAAFVFKSLNDSIDTIVDESNIFYRFLKIFKSLYPSISFDDFIKSDIKNIAIRELKPKTLDNIYDINQMSDGEKVTVYYIIQILLAPNNATIIIDEPETYLNAALYNRLWNMLEAERTDCRFIYISHRIDFIESRVDVDFIWFKKFSAPDDWQFQFLKTKISKKFPKDLLVQLSGVKKNVLFCEGDSKASLDYAIYQALFPDVSVIPVGNCDKVSQYTKSYNEEQSVFHNQAFGIVDNDLRTDEEISHLETEKVFSTEYLEIEMLLCDEEVIKAVLAANYLEENKFDNFKSRFIEKMTQRKHEVISRRIKKLYENKVQRTIYDTTTDLASNLTTLQNELISIQDTNAFEEHLTKLLKEGNYQGLIEICTLEHKEITGGIANSAIDSNFEEKAKKQLLNNQELKEKIKEKYFGKVISALAESQG